MSNKMKALIPALAAMATLGSEGQYGLWDNVRIRSATAGCNKYAKRVSNEDALTDDEKRRNAAIDAKNAAKKAARKGGH
jgi:hypothetical protein